MLYRFVLIVFFSVAILTSLSPVCSCLLQISKQQLQTVKERFQAFLNGETQIVADEAFINAVQSYYDVSLNYLFYGYFTLPYMYTFI